MGETARFRPAMRPNQRMTRDGASVTVREATRRASAAVAAFDGSADLLVANILAPELVALAGPIDAAVAPWGRLVLSGFPEARIPFVSAAFPDWVESRRRIRGNWCALVLRRR